MSQIFTCRWCHKKFFAKEEEEGITWYKRAKNYYYHKECFDEFINLNNDKNSEVWFDLIFDIFTRQLHSTYDFFKIKSQAERFVKENIATMKGIYYSLYYYYIVKNKEYKPEYGIGIIPYIYNESIEYWSNQEKINKDIMKQIIQIQELEKTGTKISLKTRKKKEKITKEPIL